VSEWKAQSMEESTDLLIIGAGPYGLAVAAYAQHLGIDHVVVGKPMDFWKVNMPAGMYLRTGGDVQIDPLGIRTIEKFLETHGLSPTDVEPLSLQFYLSYAQWFQEQKQIDAVPVLVQRLDCADSEDRPISRVHGERSDHQRPARGDRRRLQVLPAFAP
jgi:FAD-dependent urate hydroxylase